MRLLAIAAVSAAAFLFSAGVAANEEIRVNGGAAPIENIFKRIKAPFEQKTGLHVALRADGPDKAFSDLVAGKTDVATAGLAYKDWLDLMKRSGAEVANPADYQPRVIGLDKIQVLMHKDLSGVKALTKEQLKSLFTGKAVNWKDVGGPDVPVVVVFGTKIPGTNKMWQERILDGADWAAGRREVGDAANVKKMVAAVPGALGIGPLAAEEGNSVHSPETPEVARPITALTKGSPTPAVQKLYDFIKGDGQQVIAK